jgi:hypothetical protein
MDSYHKKLSVSSAGEVSSSDKSAGSVRSLRSVPATVHVSTNEVRGSDVSASLNSMSIDEITAAKAFLHFLDKDVVDINRLMNTPKDTDVGQNKNSSKLSSFSIVLRDIHRKFASDSPYASSLSALDSAPMRTRSGGSISSNNSSSIMGGSSLQQGRGGIGAATSNHNNHNYSNNSHNNHNGSGGGNRKGVSSISSKHR